MARTFQIELLLAGILQNGTPLGAGKVYTYSAGTLTNKTTWTDPLKVTSAANPIILDADGKAQVYGDGYYKFVITDSDDAPVDTIDNVYYGSEDFFNYGGTSTGAANTYLVTLTPAIPAYVDGQVIEFKAHQTNTSTTPSLNVNSLGATAIVRYDGNALLVGDIQLNQTYSLVLQSPNFYLSNPSVVADATSRDDYAKVSQVQDSDYTFGGNTGGSVNAYTLTLSPAITAYAAGQRFPFVANSTNTANCVININGIGNKDILNYKTVGNLLGGEIVTGRTYDIIYDGVQFILMNPSEDWISWTPTITTSGAASISAVTIYFAKYKITGEQAFFNFNFDCTISGSAVPEIYMSLPVTLANQFFASGCCVYSAASQPNAGVIRLNTTTKVAFSYFDFSNFTNPQSPNIEGQFFAELA